MPYFKLKETAPIVEKIRKVEELMFELGLSMDVRSGGQLVFKGESGTEVEYRDIEQYGDSFQVTTEFPAQFETKIIMYKEEE